MSVKKNPYPHNNFARTEDYLEELILWGSGERGRMPIDEASNGYEDLTVTDAEAKSLTVPEDAVSATISIEAAVSVTDKSRVIRFKENGSDPSVNSGIALGDNDLYEITSRWNLESFRVIGIEAGKSHALRVQYYRSPQNA